MTQEAPTMEHRTVPRSGVDFDRINQALSKGIPATLTMREVKTITGLGRAQIINWVRQERFPAPIDTGRANPVPEKKGRPHVIWSSAAIRKWLVDRDLPTVFGKAAQS